MKTALVIMAAGLGSRYGGGIKQLEGVGPNGEIIMDYSIHDAIEAGFNKIIFIIRKDIEPDFMEVIGDRIEKMCAQHGVEVQYAYQSLTDLPDGIQPVGERKKPWGTGQAVLACRELIQEPFVVINADDYYGKEAFVAIQNFLQHYDPKHPDHYCMAGFLLKNTLSDFGGVTRGICKVNDNMELVDVQETKNIVKTKDGAEVDGKPLDLDSFVSMNMWGLTPEFVDRLSKGFVDFFEQNKGNEDSAEFLLPIFIGQELPKGEFDVKVLQTNDKWFGVTFKEDKPQVVASFEKLIEDGVYRNDLFSDLNKEQEES
ncbi:sugar phosphate nucleotidyltransferase [uncultured Dubosiella sp.]|uniref:sugar phosphate nucleotidyltransferase n=2 Tax=uncultured Dubosiella sp. TaxID=1937011 RepID=UPI0025B553F1|nr:sugar phosphate nucleotidyltransferase [uncultured Dubosiella sp.]